MYRKDVTHDDFSNRIHRKRWTSRRSCNDEATYSLSCGVIDPAAASEKFGNAFHYRHLDYADISTFSQALKGVDQLFLMYPSQVSTRQFHLFLRYLRFTSVRHIVYLSFKDVPVFPLTPHHTIEKIIQETGIPFTIIRPGYYMQNLNLFMRDDIRFHEQIVTPAGLGRQA